MLNLSTFLAAFACSIRWVKSKAETLRFREKFWQVIVCNPLNVLYNDEYMEGIKFYCKHQKPYEATQNSSEDMIISKLCHYLKPWESLGQQNLKFGL